MRKILAVLLAAALGANVALANDYFNASGAPSTGAALVSSTMRTEFSNIGAGFDKLPALTGNGTKMVAVNSGGTALEAITAATARSNMGLVIGTNVQAWDADLDALAALAATVGMVARTGAGAFTVRTLTGTAAEITVASGDGSGTPTFSLPTALTFTGKTVTGGTFASPTLTTPALGTPSAVVLTNATGTAANLTAGNVTTNANLTGGVTSVGNAATVITNANLTGPITSTGNATAVAAQTGTGTTFVMQASPTLTTAALGSSTATTQAVDDNSTKVATTAYADRMGITLATEQATTSGKLWDFTGIPAGIKRITVMFKGFSTNGTSNYQVQLGDAGGIETTGYDTGVKADGIAGVYATSGFVVANSVGASATFSGKLTLNLENAAAFSWVGDGNAMDSTGGNVFYFAGSKSLSAELTQIRVTTVNGNDDGDAGAVNIQYER